MSWDSDPSIWDSWTWPLTTMLWFFNVAQEKHLGRKRLLLSHCVSRTYKPPQTCLLFGALTWWTSKLSQYSWRQYWDNIGGGASPLQANVASKDDQGMGQAVGNLCTDWQVHVPPHSSLPLDLLLLCLQWHPLGSLWGQVQGDAENELDVSPCLIYETPNKLVPLPGPQKVKTKGRFKSACILMKLV